MKIDQIAYYCQTDEQRKSVMKSFGLPEDAKWVEDMVTARNIFPDGTESISVGHLRFNYDKGIELELLEYVLGKHWRTDDPQPWREFLPMLSHIGIHLDDWDPMPEPNDSMKLVQETFTISHTSDYLTNPSSKGFGRKYQYRIFQLADGSYIKYIRRISA